MHALSQGGSQSKSCHVGKNLSACAIHNFLVLKTNTFSKILLYESNKTYRC